MPSEPFVSKQPSPPLPFSTAQRAHYCLCEAATGPPFMSGANALSHDTHKHPNSKQQSKSRRLKKEKKPSLAWLEAFAASWQE